MSLFSKSPLLPPAHTSRRTSSNSASTAIGLASLVGLATSTCNTPCLVLQRFTCPRDSSSILGHVQPLLNLLLALQIVLQECKQQIKQTNQESTRQGSEGLRGTCKVANIHKRANQSDSHECRHQHAETSNAAHGAWQHIPMLFQGSQCQPSTVLFPHFHLSTFQAAESAGEFQSQKWFTFDLSTSA